MRAMAIAAGGVFLACGFAGPGRAADPWPAEAWTAAVDLTHLDGAFQNNMSGAAWNPRTRTFWVCCNGGPSAFWALVEDGSGSFMIATNGSGVQARYDMGGGDFEGICQADYDEEVVYLMTEGVDQIREYNVSTYGSAVLNRQWSIGAYVPTSGGWGSEGITFVPDGYLLEQRFGDGDGAPYVSTNGMGGLMFVAHQNGGRVYAFDLNRTNGACSFVGAYKTSRSESSGLEFDRSTGLLYVWHNIGDNYLEVTELSSFPDGAERRLTPLAEFLAPKGDNLEGIAIVPTVNTDNWCLVVDDGTAGADGAVMWFRQFEHTNDLDGDKMADSWELARLSSTTCSDGAADGDHDGFFDLDEYRADTDPNDAASYLCITAISNSSPVTVHFLSSSNRLYTMNCSSSLVNGVWTNVPGAGPRPGLGGPDLIDDTNPPPRGPFYRIGARPP